MKVTVTATTGATLLVWREGDMFAARSAGSCEEPQVCLGVDLFEVIAELARLDLEDRSQGQEAVDLAGDAQWRLTAGADLRRTEPRPGQIGEVRGSR